MPSPGAKLLLLSLAEHADPDGVSFPSIQRMALMTAQSPKSVKRRLAEFESMGLVVKFERKRPNGSQSSNEYRLALALRPEDVRAPDNDCEPQDAETDDEGGGQIDPPGQVDPPTQIDPPGHGGEGDRVTGDPPITPKGTITPLKGPQPGCDDRGPEDDGFAEFQQAYPIPVTRFDRAKSLWLALTEAERQAAVAGAKAYGMFLEKYPKRAPRDAHLWLGGKEWLGHDKPAPSAPAEGSGPSVFVVEGTPQWVAWGIYRRTFDKPAIKAVRDPDSVAFGWRFPSEWPPFGQGYQPDDRGFFVVHGSNAWWAWRERMKECEPDWQGRLGLRPAPHGTDHPRGAQGRFFPSEWPPPKGGRRGDGDEFAAAF